MNIEESLECRICLESGLRSEFISPCLCDGTRKWVHSDCLNKWRIIREDRAFSRCTECLAEYVLKCEKNSNLYRILPHRFRYIIYVTRDFLSVVILLQFLIFILGFIIYVCDKADNFSLLRIMELNGHTVVFYYLCGLTLSFILLSVFAMLLFSCSTVHEDGSRSNEACVNCCFRLSHEPSTYYRRRQHNYLYYDSCLYFEPISPFSSCSDCCSCCNAQATSPPNSSNDANTCSCCAGDCSCSEGGKEMIVVLLAVVAIFAIIGLFLSIFIGMIVIQRILQRHLHLLKKKSLVMDYIVVDLEAEGEDSTNENIIKGDHDIESQLTNNSFRIEINREDFETGSVISSLNLSRSKSSTQHSTIFSTVATAAAAAVVSVHKCNVITPEVAPSSVVCDDNTVPVGIYCKGRVSPVCLDVTSSSMDHISSPHSSPLPPSPPTTPTSPHSSPAAITTTTTGTGTTTSSHQQSNLTTQQIEELSKFGLL